jgi:hypothetical protein
MRMGTLIWSGQRALLQVLEEQNLLDEKVGAELESVSLHAASLVRHM